MAVKRNVSDDQISTVNSIPLNNEEFVDDYEDSIDNRSIQIPDFLSKNKETSVPTIISQKEERMQAVLNNTPGNADAEELNHLKQLEEVAINYSNEEWQRLLLHAPSDMMSDEFKRRLGTYEDYMRNTRNNLSLLTEQKL